MTLRRNILIATAVCFVTTIYIMENARKRQITRPLAPQPDYSKKVILSWNDFFGYKTFMEPNLEELGCMIKNCRVSTNRALLDISDAVVFHWHDAQLDDLPPVKSSKQRWVLMTFEPPMYAPPKILSHLSPSIDWTATYRMDSDIPSPYGKFQSRSSGESIPAVPSPDELTRRQPLAWMNSHCSTYGRREIFVSELTSLIPVHIYGRCSKDKSLRDVPADKAFDFLAKQYVFYLSFENSVCKDYVTEKAFQPLYHGLIPVVYGGADYKRHLPPGSYIDVLDFTSIEELARYLYRVMGNWTMYASFFNWRMNFQVTQRACNNVFFCDICARLHENKLSERFEGRNLTRWWYEKRDCVHPVKNNTFSMSRKLLVRTKRDWYRERNEVLN